MIATAPQIAALLNGTWILVTDPVRTKHGRLLRCRWTRRAVVPLRAGRGRAAECWAMVTNVERSADGTQWVVTLEPSGAPKKAGRRRAA